MNKCNFLNFPTPAYFDGWPGGLSRKNGVYNARKNPSCRSTIHSSTHNNTPRGHWIYRRLAMCRHSIHPQLLHLLWLIVLTMAMVIFLHPSPSCFTIVLVLIPLLRINNLSTRCYLLFIRNSSVFGSSFIRRHRRRLVNRFSHLF